MGFPPIKTFTALIVDDEPLIRESFKDILESTRLFKTILEAQDGAMALQKLSNQAFDLVLLDINMPKMNGMEAIERYKNFLLKNKKVAEMPFVIISASLDPMIIADALKLGVKHILAKPVEMDKLINKVKEVLQSQGKAVA